MPSTRRPLNYTTTIKAKVTVTECQDLLAQAGASSTTVQMRDRRPVGLAFTIETPFGERPFRMPVDADAIHKLLKQVDAEKGWPASMVKGGHTKRLVAYDHAVNVAWRIARDWLEAQLAIIDAAMVTLDQVMLPYLEVDRGVTVYDRYLSNEQAALEASR